MNVSHHHRFRGTGACGYGWFPVLIVGIIWGCAAGHPPAPKPNALSALSFHSGGFIERHPWIKKEIRSFLGQKEVRTALGFDPLAHEHPILIRILEHRLARQHNLQVFGVTVNEQVSLSGHVFLFAGHHPLDPAELEEKPGPLYRKRIAMLSELRRHPKMLKLYRGLLVAHEVAHVGEWYTLLVEDRYVTLTGHGIADRVEIKILNALFRSGKIDRKTYRWMFRFYQRYLNDGIRPKPPIHTSAARWSAPASAIAQTKTRPAPPGFPH